MTTNWKGDTRWPDQINLIYYRNLIWQKTTCQKKIQQSVFPGKRVTVSENQERTKTKKNRSREIKFGCAWNWWNLYNAMLGSCPSNSSSVPASPHHPLALMSLQIDLSTNKHLGAMLPAEAPTLTRPHLQSRILKERHVYKLKRISHRALFLERKSHLLMRICKSKPTYLWQSRRHTKQNPGWLALEEGWAHKEIYSRLWTSRESYGPTKVNKMIAAWFQRLLFNSTVHNRCCKKQMFFTFKTNSQK